MASENKCIAERELTNSLQEPMMEEAMNFVQQEIQAENEKYQMEKKELQRQAKRERDAAMHNQGSRTNAQRQCVLRYFIIMLNLYSNYRKFNVRERFL